MTIFRLALVLVIFVAGTLTTQAGQITGTVLYKDGSKGSGLKVTGETSDGLTKSVRNDRKGRFTLTWSTKKKLLKVYVKGTVRVRNVKNGAKITIRLP